MKEWLVPIVAILAITGVEITALLNGFNGVLLSLSVAAISGLGGFKVKAMVEKRKKD